jgi:NAD(P) transhydrogenase subunit alpha
MLVGVVAETFPGERRVALVPSAVPTLAKAGCQVLVQSGAGVGAGYPDSLFAGQAARIASSRAEVFAEADAVMQVLGYGANCSAGQADLSLLRRNQILIGFQDPLASPAAMREVAATGATAFAVELMPRITRAQSMDAMSAMSTVIGYKAVLLAAATLPRMFPMLMTAAGTITPARALVIGAGVAGLQAMATARRLGAVVSAYDVRPAAKEQVQSMGARFVELPLETSDAEDASGYARVQDETFYKRQRELLETEGEVIVKAALPNIDPKHLEITVTNEAIVLKGETKHEEEHKGRNYYRREFQYGAFLRTLPLLTEVKGAEAKAIYKDGVLEVKMPKSERAKATAVKVKVDSP